MEDVLASIRRAIDENAQRSPTERFDGSLAELRVKVDANSAQQDIQRRRDHSYSPSASSSSQGFAGILGGRRAPAGNGAPPSYQDYEPAPRRADPVLPSPEEEGPYLYDGYYEAPLNDYQEPLPEPYRASEPMSAPRYLPPAPAVIPDEPQNYGESDGLLSDASSEATQAAFNRLAETITRRALGERSIADITQELLRGMLKEWLDENLPKIVERLVREEIERVVRRPPPHR